MCAPQDMGGFFNGGLEKATDEFFDSYKSRSMPESQLNMPQFNGPSFDQLQISQYDEPQYDEPQYNGLPNNEPQYNEPFYNEANSITSLIEELLVPSPYVQRLREDLIQSIIDKNWKKTQTYSDNTEYCNFIHNSCVRSIYNPIFNKEG